VTGVQTCALPICPGQITENTSGLGGISTVTNEISSIGGADIESNASYRRRLKSLINTQFGYQKIAQLTNELEPVRAAKCFQTWGVDVAFPVAAWDVAGTWAAFDSITMHGGDDVIYSQVFVPTGDRLTVKDVIIHGRRVGDPPPLRIKLYAWNTDHATTVASAPLSNKVFSMEDVNPDDKHGWQELFLPCRFGGLDYTKRYMFTIESDGDTSLTNHWECHYMASGDEYDDGEMYIDGAEEVDADIAFKTAWGGASFNLVISSLPGYSLVNYVSMVEALIINYERKAYSPICIQGNVIEAVKAYINVTATVFIDITQDWDFVIDSIRENLSGYINTLGPGDNVMFSQIEYHIMKTSGVIKINSCTIQRNDEPVITNAAEHDILIGELEIAELDTGVHGPGVYFTRGKL
jgi:hypothetical protein